MMASFMTRFSRMVKFPTCHPKYISRTLTSSLKSPNETVESQINDQQRPESWCQFYDRPAQEPIESTSILLFPGQGSQYVGMAKKLIDVPGVKDMFDLSSSMLRTNLLKICIEGPSAKLKQNIHCQPALYVTSMAAVKKLQMESPDVIEKCVAVAGYSLGEISSLVFAGVYTFEEGLHIIRVRAEAMQRASNSLSGGMSAVFLTHESQLRPALAAAIHYCKDELKLETPVVCQVASYLGSDCKIVAGNTEALEFLRRHAAQFQLKAVRPLEVSGAFHTPLMAPAVEAFKAVLQRGVGPPRAPVLPVISNVDAEPHGPPSTVPRRLVKQLTRPIRWEQTLHALYARPEGAKFPRTFGLGPARQLGSTLRMVNTKAFARYHEVLV